MRWGVRFLDLFAPARRRERETALQQPQRERRKHSTATREGIYRIRKQYKGRPWRPRQLEVRATEGVTMTHEELENEWKQQPNECDALSDYRSRSWENLDSRGEIEGSPASQTNPTSPASPTSLENPISFGSSVHSKDGQEQQENRKEQEGPRFFEFDGLDDATLINENEDRKDIERALMYEKIISEIDSEGWSNDELVLYSRLRMRGREPMLPTHWKMDFETIPGHLFGSEKKVMINSYCQNSFHATQALHKLFKLGGRVRDRELAKLPPEPMMKKEIERYIRWSQKDGQFYRKPHVPILAIITSSRKESEAKLERRIERKLKTLADNYRAAPPPQSETGDIRPMPTFYGIIISGNMFGFVTYNSASKDAPIRNVGLFDYAKHESDVWNGIAIAYIVIAARNNLIEILEDVASVYADTDDPDL
ncbi:hypothetical protein FGG08_004242 [Glutinoglossum americanum]|uniref:Uncharacterized protein n=1 Tax=Glutinoglossum americanum TaxID=1670608 RepID=A0A9P8I0X6_9PEZI|nr:hypothetical protein FGG08_004242 [Glutinoglossum americanum]